MGPFWLMMGISKKHFDAIAGVIFVADLGDIERAQLAEDMANCLAGFNPAFDPSRFFEAATGHSLCDWQRSRARYTRETRKDKSDG